HGEPGDTRATRQAVTRVKLEQARKGPMWRRPGAEAGKAESIRKNRARERAIAITSSTDRTTRVVSTACQEGSLRQPGMVVGSRPANGVGKDGGSSGCRRGAEVPTKPGNAGGGKGPYFWCAWEGAKYGPSGVRDPPIQE